MCKRIIFVALITIFLSSTVFITRFIMIPEVKATTTTVKVEPESTTGLDVDDTFSIDVTVSDVVDLYSWSLELYWHSAVLNATGRSEGSFLNTDAPEGTWFWPVNFTDNYNATHGLIYVGCGRYGHVPGRDGSGTLLTVTFKAKASGDSVIDLVNTKLKDSAEPFGNPIPHTTIDGSAHVGLIDLAIINIATPTNIPKDTMAYINITAENQGEVTQTFDVTLSYDDNPIETKTVINLPGGSIIILNFTWDTTPISIGEYTLTATATIVLGENDTTDNNHSIKIYLGIRDLAIHNVTPSKTTAPKGCPITTDVTVQNQGQATETFNVTLYYESNIIGTELVALASEAYRTVTFTWNTTEATTGNHTVSAYAHPLPYETDTTDNNFTDGIVNIVLPPDISLTNTTPFKNIVCQGYSMRINVTMKNLGPLTETFDATAYAGTATIQTLPVTLTPGSSTTTTFIWDATGFATDSYTVSAYAHPLPYETDTTDNNFTDGIIRVVYPGDVNPDGKVDMKDIAAIAKIFGSKTGDTNYNPNYDIDDNGKIDMKDIAIAAKNFGYTEP